MAQSNLSDPHGQAPISSRRNTLDTESVDIIGSVLDHETEKSRLIERRLRGRIAEGAWPVGGRVPSERQLALEFGVARNTLRRALATLAEQGLLAASVGRGTYVCGRLSPEQEQALRAAARPVAPADTAEVRLLLEPAAAALAATRAGAADYVAIDTALRDSEQAAGLEAFEAADAALHAAIIAACRNDFLIGLFGIVTASRASPRWAALKRRAASADRRALYDRQHARIVAALHERDVDAAFRAMQEHLRAVQASLSDPTFSPP